MNYSLMKLRWLLEEVSNVILGVRLNQQEKQDLVMFMRTL